MSQLRKCDRESCRTIEVPGRRWWAMALTEGEAKIRPYEPGSFIKPNEKLVCGEACMTRELAAWTAQEQARQRESERTQAEIEALERMAG